jgi:predicted HicB family RNase H-like nuclease
MKQMKHWPNLSIRLNPEALKMAKMAAAASTTTIGKWLAEAIEEKIERQRKTEWESKWLGL